MNKIYLYELCDFYKHQCIGLVLNIIFVLPLLLHIKSKMPSHITLTIFDGSTFNSIFPIRENFNHSFIIFYYTKWD